MCVCACVCVCVCVCVCAHCRCVYFLSLFFLFTSSSRDFWLFHMKKFNVMRCKHFGKCAYVYI